MMERVQGAATLKKAVRSSRTLKLVLPASLRHLIGKYATRRMMGGILMITFSYDAGEVKVCPIAKTYHSAVINLGPCSRFFEPGRVYFDYDPGGDVLFVWQERDLREDSPMAQEPSQMANI
jgi:hypothetical protein